MIDDYINNPKSIKYHIRNYLEQHRHRIENRIVLDIPAGNGATSEVLIHLKAKVYPFDLFPEYFLLKDVQCKRADIVEKIPVADAFADWVVCQEGIEHFSDPIKVFRELNRVLKRNGTLLMTTPSYSHLSAKLSYLLFESESAERMPPNEIDDVWMYAKSITPEFYLGHLFLSGLQKLRVMGKLTGFDIRELRFVRLSKGSLLLFPLFYPFILVRSCLTYLRNLKKRGGLKSKLENDIYKEQLQININPKNLLNRHTFIVFEKKKNLEELDFETEAPIRPFGEVM